MADAVNVFPGRAGELVNGPGKGVFEPAQDDDNDLEFVCRCLLWKADGTAKFTCVDGTVGEITATTGFMWDKSQIARIWATGTTLSDSEMLCAK